MRLEIGTIGKAHGLKGDVMVSLTSNRLERLEEGSILYANSKSLKVKKSRPQKKRFIVQFEGISSREAAEELNGQKLTAEPLSDPEALWVHDLIGSEVIDQDGHSRGKVAALESNPASDLLVLESDDLVPIRFIVSIEEAVIRVDVPSGLFGSG